MTVGTVVVGGGGLIGSALAARLRDAGDAVDPVPGLPWGDRAALAEAFGAVAAGVRARLDAEGPGASWRLVWAAGRAVIPSPEADHRAEVAALDDLLAALGRRLGGRAGDVLLVSSAGGVLAGGSEPPYDERTPPAPRSAYGRGKLDQELLVGEAAVRFGWQARIARVANVYGAGQDPSKPQGLVTRLCLAAVEGRPVRLYVPPTTARHYLHVSDAAALLRRLLGLPATGPGLPILRLVSAGEPVTVAELVRTVEAVVGAPIPVEWTESGDARLHGGTIALASRHPDMALSDPVPLTEGVADLLAALRRRGTSSVPGGGAA